MTVSVHDPFPAIHPLCQIASVDRVFIEKHAGISIAFRRFRTEPPRRDHEEKTVKFWWQAVYERKDGRRMARTVVTAERAMTEMAFRTSVLSKIGSGG